MIKNFNEFCKAKKCTHYNEWHIQAGKDGMIRCCGLVGPAFYIVTYPDNCIHLKEITAVMKESKEQHDAWEKLNKFNKRT